MRSKGDSQVLFDNYLRLKEAAAGPVQSYIVEGNKHFILENEFADPRQNTEYFETMTAFIEGIISFLM